MYVSSLIRENNRLESLPGFWFVVVLEVVYRLGRPQSKIPKVLRTAGTVTITRKQAEDLKIQPSLFSWDGEGTEVYEYATDFRRQLKARLLVRYRSILDK
jgi:hypothetical protein